MEFSERYEDYGIHGINPNNASQQYTICPQCEPERKHKGQKKLGVFTEKGMWHCNHCGWSGGLKHKREQTQRIIHSKILPLAKVQPSKKLELNTFAWFEKRGLSKETIIRSRVTKTEYWFSETEGTKPVICFNYFVGTEIVNVKYRSAQKNFIQSKGGAKVFYGLNDIETEIECIIVEGELDKLSFDEAGLTNCISVPDGGLQPEWKNITQKMSFLDNCIDYFEGMTRVYLALDNDAPGLRMKDELARRFGKSRCFVVSFPEGCKDANDTLVKHGKQALVYAIRTAEPYPVDGIHYMHEYRDDMRDLWEYGYPNGAKTGWCDFDEHIQFFDSLFCIITGLPSHGKSNFIDHLTIKLAIRNGWKFGVYSPENYHPKIYAHRLVELLIGKPFLSKYNGQMTMTELNEAMDWIENNIFFIVPDNLDFGIDELLEKTKHLVLKHGIKAVVIDAWNNLYHKYGSDSETDYTCKTLNRLIHFEREHGLCMFLAAHPAKMNRAFDGKKQAQIKPDLGNISGSQHWWNKAEVGIGIYRKFEDDGESTKHTEISFLKIKHKFMGRFGTCKFDYDITNQRYLQKNRKTDISEEDKQNYLHLNEVLETYPNYIEKDSSRDEAPF